MLFLLDENLPDDLSALIRSQGHRAVAAGVRRPSVSDEEIWDWASREAAILVTRDLDFPLRGRPTSPYAVILIRGTFLSRGALLAVWSATFDNFDFSALKGRIASIRRGRIRTRAL